VGKVSEVFDKHGVVLPRVERNRCPDGWAQLIDDMLTRMPKPLPKFHQIKEKLAGLRVYAEGPTPEQAHLIREAERLSSTVCQKCGEVSTGVSTVTRGHVLITLCPCCAKL
jgi:hypothetical protein